MNLKKLGVGRDLRVTDMQSSVGSSAKLENKKKEEVAYI